jgi:hypothetical protein
MTPVGGPKRRTPEARPEQDPLRLAHCQFARSSQKATVLFAAWLGAGAAAEDPVQKRAATFHVEHLLGTGEPPSVEPIWIGRAREAGQGTTTLAPVRVPALALGSKAAPAEACLVTRGLGWWQRWVCSPRIPVKRLVRAISGVRCNRLPGLSSSATLAGRETCQPGIPRCRATCPFDLAKDTLPASRLPGATPGPVSRVGALDRLPGPHGSRFSGRKRKHHGTPPDRNPYFGTLTSVHDGASGEKILADMVLPAHSLRLRSPDVPRETFSHDGKLHQAPAPDSYARRAGP